MAGNGQELPVTTIPPFADTNILPSCAAACVPLYDANGACVPPAVNPGQPAAYTSCFCADSRVTAFSTASSGVCDNACGAPGLGSIQSWFNSMCGGGGGGTTTDTDGSATTGLDDDEGSSGNSDFKLDEDTGDWLSGHWQYVVMIVVLVVGIAAIWVGACVWRRRYVRKRDRLTLMTGGKPNLAGSPSASPTQWDAPTTMTSQPPNLGIGAVDNRDPRNKGRFMPDSPAVGSSSSPTPGADEQELKPKKKGLFKGRS
ncbi:hypothetical protein N3K66_000280 [Trichothecium roseum]|uniref:Uncharacterized protein n=1 Tax=Trichothecium roseum TaxID=47278 RepID=A0ACC0VBG0_9HYPO|nr:hypothetical protein N3K66_000280 [Trichothecium roseum]